MGKKAVANGRGARCWPFVALFYGGALQQIFKKIRYESLAIWRELRQALSAEGVARMADYIASAETRRVIGRGAVTFGAMAVVAVGAPLVQKRADQQRSDHEWSLKAHAFVVADVEGDGVNAANGFSARRIGERLEGAPGVADRAATDSFQTFRPVHFAHAERQRRDQECLSRAIFYEAGGEPVTGQLAVAEVILNRVRHRLYPNNVCDVIYQGSERTTGCQFSFTCDGAESRAPSGSRWRRSRITAKHALMGLSGPVTGDATHYHANYVDPYWAPRLVHTRTIGTHIFYRFPKSGEGRRRGGA